MRKHLVWKWCAAAAFSSALVGAGATVSTAVQAGAAVHKKHPPKHKKKNATSDSNKLKALASGVAGEKSATFEVVYKTTTDGHTESVTFAQSPPKFLVKIGTGGSVIYTGTETLYCETASTCVSTGDTTNPLAPIENLFSATTAKDFFDAAEVEIGAKEAGYKVSFSSATFGGLSSECVAVSGHGESGKYCVAKNGLITYSGSAEGSITLTSYTSNVPATAFAPPSGATIITEPSS